MLTFVALIVTAADEPASQPAPAVEEVVVTARKRREKMMDTPIAMSVFGGEALKERTITRLSEVAQFAPNLSIDEAGVNSGGAASVVFIRGIGQTDFIISTDPGVATYMDGVYLPRPYAQLLRLGDVERVEVLRGPQGTLFGKNATGGVLNVISRKPDNQPAAYARLSTGSFRLIDGEAMLNVPIVQDRLLTKFVFSGIQREGFMANPGLPDRKLGDDGSLAGRVTVSARPTDNVELDVIADYAMQRRQGSPLRLVKADPNAPLASIFNLLLAPPGGPLWGPGLISSNPYSESGTGPARDDLESWGISSHARIKLGGSVSLTNIVAYRNMRTLAASDLDAAVLDYGRAEVDTKRHNVSEELRFAGSAFDERLNWLAGGFYFFETAREQSVVQLAPGGYPALEAFPGPLDSSPLSMPTAPGGRGNPFNEWVNFDFTILNQQLTHSAAGFADATFRLTEIFRFSGGIRYTHDFKTFSVSSTYATGSASIPDGVRSANWGGLTGRIGAEQHWTPNLMSYEAYSRGFKSGGFNGRPLRDTDVLPYRPEFVNSFEVGAKVQAWRRLQATAAGFYNDYQDIQLNANTLDSNGRFGVIVTNAARSRIAGFEVEGVVKPLLDLQLNAAVGYLNTAYLALDQSLPLDVRINTPMPKAPALTVNAGVQYALPIGDVVRLIGRVDYQWRSKVYHDILGTEETSQKPVGLLSARLGAEFMRGTWEISIAGTNLTNESYIVNGLVGAGFGVATVVQGRPREWRLSVAARI